MLSVLDCLLAKAEERLVSLIALLDLSVAFNTLDHFILPKRLEVSFEVRDIALEWFAFCLSISLLSFDGTVSAPSPLVYEVPWDSVLGPVLFTLYSQPLSDVSSAHGCDFRKYADNTELSHSASPDECCSVQTGIQKCIDDLLSWMDSSKLVLNTDKIDVMAVGTSSRLSLEDGAIQQYSLRNFYKIHWL